MVFLKVEQNERPERRFKSWAQIPNDLLTTLDQSDAQTNVLWRAQTQITSRMPAATKPDEQNDADLHSGADRQSNLGHKQIHVHIRTRAFEF